jgi:hypothetical protein
MATGTCSAVLLPSWLLAPVPTNSLQEFKKPLGQETTVSNRLRSLSCSFLGLLRCATASIDSTFLEICFCNNVATDAIMIPIQLRDVPNNRFEFQQVGIRVAFGDKNLLSTYIKALNYFGSNLGQKLVRPPSHLRGGRTFSMLAYRATAVNESLESHLASHSF